MHLEIFHFILNMQLVSGALKIECENQNYSWLRQKKKIAVN